MAQVPFPSFAENWEPTRATLHAYAKALGTLAQTHLPKHPAWWHISLKPKPNGLTTENMPLPGGGLLNGRLDVRSHEVMVEASTGWHRSFDFRDARSGTEMADAIISAVAELGLTGAYVRKDFEDDGVREYDVEAAAPYWAALTNAAAGFELHRAALDHRSVGPVQFWPHGFDLAFEWFGTKTYEYEGTTHPAQLNLGFYSSGRPYFYSNPYPFTDEELRKCDLSVGDWCEDMFEGSILYYDEIADDPDGAAKLSTFAREVHEAARPTLTA